MAQAAQNWTLYRQLTSPHRRQSLYAAVSAVQHGMRPQLPFSLHKLAIHHLVIASILLGSLYVAAFSGSPVKRLAQAGSHHLHGAAPSSAHHSSAGHSHAVEAFSNENNMEGGNLNAHSHHGGHSGHSGHDHGGSGSGSGGSGDGCMVMMPMSFEWTLSTVLWFKPWTVSSPGGYFACILCLVALSLGHEALAAYRGRLLRAQLASSAGGRPAAGGGGGRGGEHGEPLLGAGGSRCVRHAFLLYT